MICGSRSSRWSCRCFASLSWPETKRDKPSSQRSVCFSLILLHSLITPRGKKLRFTVNDVCRANTDRKVQYASTSTYMWCWCWRFQWDKLKRLFDAVIYVVLLQLLNLWETNKYFDQSTVDVSIDSVEYYVIKLIHFWALCSMYVLLWLLLFWIKTKRKT